MLMEAFADAFRFEGVFTDQQGLQHLGPGGGQVSIGECAAVTGNSHIRMHRDQRMDGIVRLDLCGPSARRAFARQRRHDDTRDTGGLEVFPQGRVHAMISCGVLPVSC